MMDESQLISRAVKLHATGKLEATEELLFLVVENNKLAHKAYHLLGQCLREKKNFRAAITCLETACRLAELTGYSAAERATYDEALKSAKFGEREHLAQIERERVKQQESVKAAEGDQAARCAALPAIFINTLPKAASTFLVMTLRRTLDAPFVDTSPGYFPYDHVFVEGLLNLKKRGGVAKNHLDASDFNVAYLSKLISRWILVLRDPRQVTLSWAHYLPYLRKIGVFNHPMPLYPDWYFESPFEGQLDWLLDHYLPEVVRWTENWLKVYDSSKHNILLTTYEELIADDVGLIKKILSFYGLDLPREEIVVAEKTMECVNFRSGDPAEWQKVFTAEQRSRADSLLPDSLRTRFGWD